ncbi:MAG: hypothetical protein R6X12_03295 [bacterium]
MSWTRIFIQQSQRGWCHALAGAGAQSDIIYAGGYIATAGAVARSTNRGASWLETAAAPADTVFGLAVDPFDADRVFAATSGGVYRTTDGGAGWTRVSTERGLRAVAFYPGGPDTVLAGGDNGVLVSRDRGQSWQAMSEGLAGQSVTCLAFTATDAVRLYAGTARGAAYRYSFPTGVAGPGSGRGRADRAGFPAIVRGVLRIGDRGPGTGDRAELLDISGRKMMDLAPGENDVRHLSPGVYFVRAVGGEPPAAGCQKVVVTR